MKQTLDEITARILALKTRMIELVAGLPDNTAGVTRITDGEGNSISPFRSCMVSLSTIGANGGILSPSYYMTRDAKETLKAMIEHSSLESLGTKIEQILATGRIKCGTGQTERLCPEFTKALADLWNKGGV